MILLKAIVVIMSLYVFILGLILFSEIPTQILPNTNVFSCALNGLFFFLMLILLMAVYAAVVIILVKWIEKL